MPQWRPILERHLPVLVWGAEYNRQTFANDMIVAAIVTIMLIPQSLAYAMVAGLPPVVGLYASMAPLVLYAVFGTSRTLAVGPVAVVSLMTAAAVAPLAGENSPAYLGAAVALATLSGVLLLTMGLLRLGFLANFLSHQVIAGFITASALQIAAGQVAPLLGIPAKGHSFVELVLDVGRHFDQIHLPTAAIGLSSLGFLFWVRSRLQPLLLRAGLGERSSDMLARTGPVAAVALAIGVVWSLHLDARGVSVVGAIPRGLPQLALPPLDAALWARLFVPALLISIVGYVESISVAHTLAARRRQRIDPDQELIALGAANLGSAVSGGFPVTGGFARSVVNFEAGAETPAAGVFAAVGIALAALFLTPLLFHLPHATLAATIVIAVLSLVEIGAFRRAYAYSPADAAAMAATIGVTLGWGVEPGLLAGVGLSIALHLFRISRPHVALVGQVPGTQHFRNVDRHTVVTDAAIASIRVDESLCFPNARFLEDRINELVAASPTVRHVVLVCSAVNEIDASALESLETVNSRLRDGGITFHLSEVKGPVMDRLKRSHFPRDLTGQIHLSQYDAICAIDADLARSTLEDRRVDTLVDQSIAATRDASLREQHPPRTKEDMMPVTVAELMAAARSAVPDISHEEARKLLDAGRALPVDVRDAAEVESSGRIKGALHVSRGHLEFKADPASPVHEAALDPELTILVYCNSGGRAALAAKALKDMGFRDVRNLGGFRDWVAAGGPVER